MSGSFQARECRSLVCIDYSQVLLSRIDQTGLEPSLASVSLALFAKFGHTLAEQMCECQVCSLALSCKLKTKWPGHLSFVGALDGATVVPSKASPIGHFLKTRAEQEPVRLDRFDFTSKGSQKKERERAFALR